MELEAITAKAKQFTELLPIATVLCVCFGYFDLYLRYYDFDITPYFFLETTELIFAFIGSIEGLISFIATNILLTSIYSFLIDLYVERKFNFRLQTEGLLINFRKHSGGGKLSVFITIVFSLIMIMALSVIILGLYSSTLTGTAIFVAMLYVFATLLVNLLGLVSSEQNIFKVNLLWISFFIAGYLYVLNDNRTKKIISLPPTYTFTITDSNKEVWKTDSTTHFLGIMRNYYFFWNARTSESIVISRSNIKEVTFKPFVKSEKDSIQ